MQRVVMLRVGITLKQIEDKHVQKCINFSSLNYLVGHKKIWGHCPRMPPVVTGLNS